MNYLSIELIKGNAVHTALSDNQFLNQWSILYDKCKHATIFQHPSFVCTWDKTYSEKWQPVIAKSTNYGDLVGLWLLAYNPEKQILVHAGAHQAEYQAWITLPGEDVAFLSKAWKILKEHFEFKELHFKYLPCKHLYCTLQAIHLIKNCLIVKKYKRPLMGLGENEIKVLFSKRNKRRINRLKKMGNLEFRRITDPTEFELVFDELISYHDFRMGAINKICPFQKDQLKRQFYSNLLSANKDTFFVGVSYLQNKPIAAELAGLSNGTISLYLGMHAPFLSKHSLGKIHLIQMCDYLSHEKINIVDLTPGGDSWKEQFATSHDEVAYAVVYNSVFKKNWVKLRSTIHEQSKVSLTKIGIKPESLKRSFHEMPKKSRTITKIIKPRKRNSINREIRMYVFTKSKTFDQNETFDNSVKCNSIGDLLIFKPEDLGSTCWKFLSEANTLFERGAFSYTISSNDYLAANGWMLTNQTVFREEEIEQSITLPTKGSVLFKLYANPLISKPEITRTLVGFMLKEAFTKKETENIYIFVKSNDLEMRETIEKMDFKYQKTYFRDTSVLLLN